MKTYKGHTNDSSVFEQLRQQIGLEPTIHSFPASTTSEQSCKYSIAHTFKPSIMYAETSNCLVLNPDGDEGSLLQTVKGVVRSFVFFNWKDHA